jgi:predicted RNA-binding protein with PIN domain
VRWIVDAMNVIGTRPNGWWKNRRRAMVGLVDQLERWASAEGHHVIVVFERPTSPPIRLSVIEIGHAPNAGANSADDEIVRLIRADDRPQEINVVTSDIRWPMGSETSAHPPIRRRTSATSLTRFANPRKSRC